MNEDEKQEQDRRLTRMEALWPQVEQKFVEIKDAIAGLSQEIRSNYVPRDVFEERLRAVSEREGRLEARVRDQEAAVAMLQTRPGPKPEEPGWVKVLIALVPLLVGLLLGKYVK